MSKRQHYKIVPVYAYREKRDKVCFSIQQLLENVTYKTNAPEAGVLDKNIITGFTIINSVTKQVPEDIQVFYKNIPSVLADFKRATEHVLEKQTINPAAWESIIRYAKEEAGRCLTSVSYKVIPYIQQSIYSNPNCLEIKINILDERANIHLSQTVTSDTHPHPLEFKREIHKCIQILTYAIDNTHPDPIVLSPEDKEDIEFF